jgi:hypothetical protein
VEGEVQVVADARAGAGDVPPLTGEGKGLDFVAGGLGHHDIDGWAAVKGETDIFPGLIDGKGG